MDALQWSSLVKKSDSKINGKGHTRTLPMKKSSDLEILIKCTCSFDAWRKKDLAKFTKQLRENRLNIGVEFQNFSDQCVASFLSASHALPPRASRKGSSAYVTSQKKFNKKFSEFKSQHYLLYAREPGQQCSNLEHLT